MASQLTLSIVTPERELVRVQADEVELPGSEGYFGVLPGHTPMLATLTVGRLTYRAGQDVRVLASGPTPRVVLLHGGIYPVHLAMESFGGFLAGMGYPEAKIRSPADGSWSHSPYESSVQLAGLLGSVLGAVIVLLIQRRWARA